MRINKESLRESIEKLLVAVGETKENAEIAAHYMTLCDARGVTTHGSHMMNPICDRREAGQLSFPTTLSILNDEGAVCIVDGNDGLGQVAADRACRIAAEKARRFGVSSVSLRNTNNVGALGLYVEELAREGFIAVMCCNASPAMSPWGAMEQFTGTQPFAIGIYTGKDTVFSADMATAVVARGKIRKALREGTAIPDTWALDEEGRPTTDPAAAIKGTLLPMGGPKGSAIALAIDIIAGMLSGSNYAPNVKAIHYPEGNAGVGGSVTVIDIAHFMDIKEFEGKIGNYIETVRNLKRAEGVSRIFIPGEIEYEKTADSLENGIELTEKAVEALNGRLSAYGIAPLAGLE